MNMTGRHDEIAGNGPESSDFFLHKTDFDEISFYLKSLSDTAGELKNTESIEEMLKNFLLIIMGNFGVAQGFILWIDTETGKKKLISRGLADGDIKILNNNLPGILNMYCSSASIHTASVKDIKKQYDMQYILCPKDTEILFQWHTGSGLSGLAGLGKRITAESFTFLNIQFLTCFLSSLIPHLCYSQSIKNNHKLNAEIHNKDLELAQLKERTQYSQDVLNRRLYYLNTLYDTLIELGSFSNSETITETFLLMILGTFSATGGYSLLIDKKDHTARVSCRGIAKEKLETLPAGTIEKLVSAFLKRQKDQNRALFNIRVVTDKNILAEISFSLEPGIGVFFFLDETALGITILGNKLTEEEYSEEDQNILKTLANNYILFLKNVRSFEIVKKLNIELEQRNFELEQTVNELKTSQNRVRVLETVKNHFSSIITKEMEKSKKVSIKDFIIILCASLVLGLVFNLANPEGVDIVPRSYFRKPPPFISIVEAKQKYDAGTVLFVDARPAGFFEQKHIKGAENLPLPLFDFVYMMKLSSIDPKKEIIVYGRNISKHYDEEVAFKLESRNHKNLKLLSGGIDAWQKAGFPTEP